MFQFRGNCYTPLYLFPKLLHSFAHVSCTIPSSLERMTYCLIIFFSLHLRVWPLCHGNNRLFSETWQVMGLPANPPLHKAIFMTPLMAADVTRGRRHKYLAFSPWSTAAIAGLFASPNPWGVSINRLAPPHDAEDGVLYPILLHLPLELLPNPASLGPNTVILLSHCLHLADERFPDWVNNCSLQCTLQ